MVDGSKSKQKMKDVFLTLQMQLSPIKKNKHFNNLLCFWHIYV